MNQKRLRALVLVFVLLFVVFWIVISSAKNIDAKTNITPTLYATNWNYLPYIRGLIQGPTATATLPPPTRTPWAANTQTPTATATATNTPAPTATSTPSPTATNTVAPPNLEAPTLYDIVNPDQDGNFAIVWSAVAGAEFYQLQQNYNGAGFEEIYRGSELSMVMSDIAPGEYCYNVRARGGDKWSDWAGEKCTTVVGEPDPEYMCEFETLYDGPRSMPSDIEMLHDGRLFITYTSEEGATIFDPRTRSFKQVVLPYGGGFYAAVLADGSVLMTVGGNDAHSMIYDPVKDETTRFKDIVNCLDYYRVIDYGLSLMTYCGDDHGYIYDWRYGAVHEYWFDIYRSSSNISYLIPQDIRTASQTLVTTGLIGDMVLNDGWAVYDTWPVFNIWDRSDLAWAARSAISYDMSKIYFSGGKREISGTPIEYTVKEAYVVELDNYTFKRIPDMRTKRFGHEILGLADGNMIVLGGIDWDGDYENTRYLHDIEVYIPAKNKWVDAGSLNIGRIHNKTVQLLNGEIFVYGGNTEPGPGYSYIAPPEIGRCEMITDN